MDAATCKFTNMQVSVTHTTCRVVLVFEVTRSFVQVIIPAMKPSGQKITQPPL